jgi:glutamine synthetase
MRPGRNRTLSADHLAAAIADGTVDTVLVVFPDHQGRLVGKRCDGQFYLDVVRDHGTENCNYLIATDMDDNAVPGYRFANYELGYGDMRAVPDEATIRLCPWIRRTALVICDLQEVDSCHRIGVSPRQILRDQIDAAAGAGFRPMIGSEIEFFLFHDSFDEAHAKSYRGLRHHSPFLQDYAILQTTKDEYVVGRMRRQLKAAGLPVETSKGEAGRGQHELNITFMDALAMADANAFYKNAAKEIAARAGRSVTFMAKYDMDDTGSSYHIHSSLWTADGTSSVMPGDGPHHMSDTFRWYLGGLLATARELSLMFAPTVNSYKRFQTGSWAPTAIGWGVDNRTLGFRVVGHGAGMRVECRIPGADANGYHAFAATIAGGLYGIRHRIEPGEPYAGNGYDATDLARIPWNIVDAIELWRGSAIAKECFGPDVHQHVLNAAEQEWLAFNHTVTEWERRRYFERG